MLAMECFRTESDVESYLLYFKPKNEKSDYGVMCKMPLQLAAG